MAAPSNIRINPFIGDGGTTNYVDFTEVHIIPAVSPFVVRLNEVPQKKDPSNMKVVYVDETTGAPTTTVLTEVAATPGAGEFRPDYSTNADGDEDWNTGLIEFSSADAGKSIQVSYTGMGTLAGVKNNRFPAWWLDRGDGSDGDFRPTGNTTISGLKQYRSVFIPAGVTVSVDKYVRICCQGAFINLGNINASGTGGVGGAGGKSSGGNRGTTNATNGFVGATAPYGMGGAGGAGDNYNNYFAAGAGGMTNYGMYYTSNAILESEIIVYGAGGSGGGACVWDDGENFVKSNGGVGGTGGGGIRLTCASFKNNGSITSNGNAGNAGGSSAGGGGGGNGGVVIIVTFINLATGKITVNGGAGNTRGAAGGAGYYVVKELGVM